MKTEGWNLHIPLGFTYFFPLLLPLAVPFLSRLTLERKAAKSREPKLRNSFRNNFCFARKPFGVDKQMKNGGTRSDFKRSEKKLLSSSSKLKSLRPAFANENLLLGLAPPPHSASFHRRHRLDPASRFFMTKQEKLFRFGGPQEGE
jgi:hypothetical protein